MPLPSGKIFEGYIEFDDGWRRVYLQVWEGGEDDAWSQRVDVWMYATGEYQGYWELKSWGGPVRAWPDPLGQGGSYLDFGWTEGAFVAAEPPELDEDWAPWPYGQPQAEGEPDSETPPGGDMFPGDETLDPPDEDTPTEPPPPPEKPPPDSVPGDEEDDEDEDEDEGAGGGGELRESIGAMLAGATAARAAARELRELMGRLESTALPTLASTVRDAPERLRGLARDLPKTRIGQVQATEATSVYAAEPVDLLTGAWVCSHVDAHLPGLGPALAVTRCHSSRLYAQGSFGLGWEAWFDASVRELPSGALYVRRGDGSGAFFGPADSGFAPPPGHEARVSRRPDGTYQLRDAAGLYWRFDAAGRVAAVFDADGWEVLVARRQDGRPTGLADVDGRTLSFDLDSQGRITRTSDDLGRQWRYGYDRAGRLIDVFGPPAEGNPTGRRWRMDYGGGADVDPRARALVVTLADATGASVVQNRYGSDASSINRVISQSYAGGEWLFTYRSLTEDIRAALGQFDTPVFQVDVTDPRGTVVEYFFNGHGGVTEERVRRRGRQPLRTQFRYNRAGLLVETILPRGNRLAYSWTTVADGRLRVTEVARCAAQAGEPWIRMGYLWDPSGMSVGTVSPTGGRTEFVRDGEGRVTSAIEPAITLPDGGETRPVTAYAYDGRGRVVSVTQPDGLVIDYRYESDTVPLVTEILVDGATWLAWTYDDAGRVTEVRDAAGATVTQEWDESDQLVRQQAPLGAARQFRYQKAGRLAALLERNADSTGAPETPEWIETRYEYDAHGRPVRTVAPLESGRTATVTYQWDAADLRAVTGPSGERVEYDYNERGLLSERRIAPSSPSAGRETFAYDDNGNLVRWQEASGALHSLEYDSYDRPMRQVLPNGAAVLFSRNKDGFVTRLVGQDREERQLFDESASYDARGLPIEFSHRILNAVGGPGRVTSRATYDIMGRLVSTEDPSGAITQLVWTTSGDLEEVIDPVGGRLTLSWDPGGRLARIGDSTSGGDVIAYTLTSDVLGRVTSFSDALGNIERYAYDTRGLLRSVTLADGTVETRSYDVGGRLVTRTVPWPDPSGQPRGISYAYNLSGQMVSVTDPDGLTTEFVLDERGEVRQVVGPDASVALSVSRDRASRIVETRDARGCRIAYRWDAVDNLIRREVIQRGGAEGVALETFEYDAVGNLVSARNAAHTYGAEYDSLGRCHEESVDGERVVYRYGSDRALSAIEYPSGGRVDFVRNSLGQATRVDFSPAMGAGQDAWFVLEWLDGQRLERIVDASGLETTHEYDRAGRLLSTRVASGQLDLDVFSFVRDSTGRVRVRFRSNQGAERLDYDSLGQLMERRWLGGAVAPDLSAWRVGGGGVQGGLDAIASAVEASPGGESVKWEFSAGGDLLAVEDGGVRTSNVVGPAHRLSSVGPTGLVYDAAGNVTEDGQRRLYYDYLNRLVRVESLGGVQEAALSYDALGRLRIYTTGAGSTTCTYAGLELLEENDGAGPRCYCSAHGVDQSLAVAFAGETRRLHRDQTWSVCAVSDQDGEIVERYRWAPFGRLEAVLDGDFAPLIAGAPLAALFQGRPSITGGILDFRQRVLLPEVGRFAQTDPAGLAGDLNPYRFAQNDPYLFVDPTGEWAFVPMLVGFAVGGGFAWYANRDKKGKDFWVAVGAGAIGGAISLSPFGHVSAIAGGAVAAGIVGYWEGGGKRGDIRGGVRAGVLHGLAGAVAGGVGSFAGARIATGVTGLLYASFARGALRTVARSLVGRHLTADRAFLIANHLGTAAGAVAEGVTGGFSGGLLQGTGTMLLNGQSVNDALRVGFEAGFAGATDIGPSVLFAVGSKASMQLLYFAHWRTLVKTIGEEAEFFARNQSGNAKATYKTPEGKDPDLWGDALPWRSEVYGDIKNTRAIPQLQSQNGQLQSIFDAIPNRFVPNGANPNGNRMTIFHRPGIRRPGKRHSMHDEIKSGEIVLEPIQQGVFAPPSTTTAPGRPSPAR
ncbi:MAG: RHS repeat domain-containing protein [Thermoleophilia bacterium]